MSSDPSCRPVEILLVEDNPDDVQLIWEALHEGNFASQLNIVTDGDEALAYLHGEGGFCQALRPDLILLDLRLPKKGGLEVLAEIKADEELRPIPVIILSSSTDSDEILKAYNLQASCYITKPEDLEEFDRVMNSIKDFCLTVVRLPPRKGRDS